MSANFETGFFVRVPAWHGLGTVITEAPDSRSAIVAAGLDWKVLQQEATINVNGVDIPTGFICNYRDRDNKVFGMITDRYHPVQNDEAFNFTDSLIDSGEVRYETAGAIDGGKTVWMLAKMPKTSILGDDVEPFLLFSNSHDGKKGCRVTMTPTRVVCQNTLNYAFNHSNNTWSFNHTGDIQAKLEEARHTLTKAKEYMSGLNNSAEELVKIKFSPAQVQDILNKLFPVDEDEYTPVKLRNQMYLRDMFMNALSQDDLANFTGTGWAMVNAAADFVGHTEPLRMTSNYQERVLKSFIGGNTFVNQVYNLVSAAA